MIKLMKNENHRNCNMKISFVNIQSFLKRVCDGSTVLRDNATQIVTIPTTTTTIVAAIGTAMFKSTHSGNHGNNILTSGASLTGGIVPGKMEH